MRRLGGLAVLAVAVAFAWGDVAFGQAHAGGWIGGAAANLQMAETLFSLFVFAPLLVGGLIGGALERRNAAAPGRRPGAAVLIGLATGAAGLSVAVVLARLAGVLADGTAPVPPRLVWGAAAIALQVVAEEVYFRGWLQPALMRRWGWWPGLIAGALAFAALHVAGGARAPVSLLNLFLGGVMFGLFAVRGGGIAAAAGAHWAWNAAEQLVWGLDPNPGIGPFGSLLDKELVGRALWGGSADGLNGGIGMTVALLAILLPLFALGRGEPTGLRVRVFSPSGAPG